MKKKYFDQSNEGIGIRFLLFRKAIGKTLLQMASELKTEKERIVEIEKGDVELAIEYLHYLHVKYGLDMNWIVCNKGEMFIGENPPGLDDGYILNPPPGEGDPGYEEYRELFLLMRIPVVRKAIMGSVKEIIDRLRME
jgi:transcriptional regulator with XRE-family HTH domain